MNINLNDAAPAFTTNDEPIPPLPPVDDRLLYVKIQLHPPSWNNATDGEKLVGLEPHEEGGNRSDYNASTVVWWPAIYYPSIASLIQYEVTSANTNSNHIEKKKKKRLLNRIRLHQYQHKISDLGQGIILLLGSNGIPRSFLPTTTSTTSSTTLDKHLDCGGNFNNQLKLLDNAAFFTSSSPFFIHLPNNTNTNANTINSNNITSFVRASPNLYRNQMLQFLTSFCHWKGENGEQKEKNGIGNVESEYMQVFDEACQDAFHRLQLYVDQQEEEEHDEEDDLGQAENVSSLLLDLPLPQALPQLQQKNEKSKVTNDDRDKNRTSIASKATAPSATVSDKTDHQESKPERETADAHKILAPHNTCPIINAKKKIEKKITSMTKKDNSNIKRSRKGVEESKSLSLSQLSVASSSNSSFDQQDHPMRSNVDEDHNSLSSPSTFNSICVVNGTERRVILFDCEQDETNKSGKVIHGAKKEKKNLVGYFKKHSISKVSAVTPFQEPKDDEDFTEKDASKSRKKLYKEQKENDETEEKTPISTKIIKTKSKVIDKKQNSNKTKFFKKNTSKSAKHEPTTPNVRMSFRRRKKTRLAASATISNGEGESVSLSSSAEKRLERLQFQSLEDDTSIPTFDTAWQILKEKFGFEYDSSTKRYILPTKIASSGESDDSNKNNNNSVGSRTWFTNTIELHKALCVHGIPMNPSVLLPLIMNSDNDIISEKKKNELKQHASYIESKRESVVNANKVVPTDRYLECAERKWVKKALNTLLSMKDVLLLKRWVSSAFVPPFERSNINQSSDINPHYDYDACLKNDHAVFLLRKCGYRWNGKKYIVPGIPSLNNCAVKVENNVHYFDHLKPLRSYICRYGLQWSFHSSTAATTNESEITTGNTNDYGPPLSLYEYWRLASWATVPPYDHDIFRFAAPEGNADSPHIHPKDDEADEGEVQTGTRNPDSSVMEVETESASQNMNNAKSVISESSGSFHGSPFPVREIEQRHESLGRASNAGADAPSVTSPLTQPSPTNLPGATNDASISAHEQPCKSSFASSPDENSRQSEEQYQAVDDMQGSADSSHNKSYPSSDQSSRSISPEGNQQQAIRRKLSPFLQEVVDLSKNVESDETWPYVWAQLKSAGWSCAAGRRGVYWCWTLPNCSVTNGIPGEHYFTSEFEVKDFAVAYLGWKGDEKYRSEKLLQQGMATGRRVGRNTIVEESRLSQRRNKMRQGRVLFTQEFDHNSDNDNSSATNNSDCDTPQRSACVETPSDSSCAATFSSPYLENAIPLAKDFDMEGKWALVWKQMKAVGWTCQSGKGETDWFFVFPNSSADDGIKGKDYFTSEFEVKQFAETVLGWKGDAIYRREKEEHDALTTGKRRATLEAVSSQHPLRTTNLTRIPSKRKNWKQNGKARPRLNAEIVEATETRKRSQHIENEIDRAVESKKSRQSQADDASNKENTYTNSQLKHSVEAEEEDCRLPRDAPQVRPTSVSSNFGEDKKKPPDYNKLMRQAIAGDGVPGKQIHLSLEKMTVVEFLEQCKIDLQPSSVGRFNNDHADVGRPKSSTPMELTFRFFLQAIVTAGAGEATGSSKLSGSSALIYGNPGTGKTTAVKRCAEYCVALAKSEESIVGWSADTQPVYDLVVEYFNSAHMQDGCSAQPSTLKSQIISIIAKSLRLPTDASISAIEKVLDTTRKIRSKRTMMILVIDEIDLLINAQEQGKNGIVHKLLLWASNISFAFSLIGISNCSDFGMLKNLTKTGLSENEWVSHSIAFRPYNGTEIQSIIQGRVPCGVFDTFALGLIGKKISSTSGDARRALELASKSITFCLEDIPDEEMKKPIAQRFLDGAMSEPIVTLNHVMKAVRETIGQRLTESIYALPESAKVILCVGVTLRQCLPASEAIRVGELATFCKEASRYSIMEEITKSEFLSLVHLLVDSGLFTVGNTSTISRDYYSCAFDDMTIVNFDVQLHDLECALATTLMDRPFYRKMAEYVEQKYGRL